MYLTRDAFRATSSPKCVTRDAFRGTPPPPLATPTLLYSHSGGEGFRGRLWALGRGPWARLSEEAGGRGVGGEGCRGRGLGDDGGGGGRGGTEGPHTRTTVPWRGRPQEREQLRSCVSCGESAQGTEGEGPRPLPHASWLVARGRRHRRGHRHCADVILVSAIRPTPSYRGKVPAFSGPSLRRAGGGLAFGKPRGDPPPRGGSKVFASPAPVSEPGIRKVISPKIGIDAGVIDAR